VLWTNVQPLKVKSFLKIPKRGPRLYNAIAFPLSFGANRSDTDPPPHDKEALAKYPANFESTYEFERHYPSSPNSRKAMKAPVDVENAQPKLKPR